MGSFVGAERLTLLDSLCDAVALNEQLYYHERGMRRIWSFLTMLMLGTLLSSCTQGASNNVQSEQLRKRALRNQAKLGLAFLFQAVGSSDFESQAGSLKAFETLIKENTSVSHVYEYGWLTSKEKLQESWLSEGPLSESLAWKNYDLLKGLCPQCGVWNSGMILMAVGNLDEDPDLDVWTMDQNRIFVHLLED